MFEAPVPNVPCGVESQKEDVERLVVYRYVPNVPCGVESVKRGGGVFGEKFCS